MSYTEIYRITKTGNTKCIAEVKNAFRGAMSVWNYLEDKYLPPKQYYGMKVSRMTSFDPGEQQEVWDLSKDPRLTEAERICMLSTFDNVMVLKDDIKRLCKAFREFQADTSLQEQAEILQKVIDDKHCYAICWNQTSVNGDFPKNVDGKCWDLFKSIKTD